MKIVIIGEEWQDKPWCSLPHPSKMERLKLHKVHIQHRLWIVGLPLEDNNTITLQWGDLIAFTFSCFFHPKILIKYPLHFQQHFLTITLICCVKTIIFPDNLINLGGNFRSTIVLNQDLYLLQFIRYYVPEGWINNLLQPEKTYIISKLSC